MALVFRNIDVTPDDAVSEWGIEGILTSIERGGLSEWSRIVYAITKDPHGEVSLDLEEALDIAESPGVADTLRRALERARESENDALSRKVRSLVSNCGMSRADLAAKLGTSRSRLSSYEHGQVMPSAAVVEKLQRMVDSRRKQLVP